MVVLSLTFWRKMHLLTRRPDDLMYDSRWQAGRTCRVGLLWDTVAGPSALTTTGTWKRLLERATAAPATLKASDMESQDFLLKMEFTSWMTCSCVRDKGGMLSQKTDI